MLTVQEFPSALSVPTTLAARPLSARSLLRALRLALRDGGGRAGTGSGTPSITLAFFPHSPRAINSFRTATLCSRRSSLLPLNPAGMLQLHLPRHQHCADLQIRSRRLAPHPLEHLSPMLLPILR